MIVLGKSGLVMTAATPPYLGELESVHFAAVGACPNKGHNVML